MGHGNTAYVVLGIERELEPKREDDQLVGAVLPNGTTLESYLSYVPNDMNIDPKSCELNASYQFEGNKFLIGYVLASIDYRGGHAIDGRAENTAIRQKLLDDLRKVGFEVEDRDIKTYLHLDNEQWDPDL